MVELKLVTSPALTPALESSSSFPLINAGTGAAKAKRLVLEPSITVEAVLQAVGRECLGNFLRHELAALAGESEAFHQMRVALRRLRSALSAIKSLLPAEQYRQVQGELKWLAGSLGPARDWDVFATNLLAPVRSALPEAASLKQLAEATEERRRASHDAAQNALRSRRYMETVSGLVRWFESRGWRDQPASEPSGPLLAPIADLAPELIERRWRQARKRSKRFAELSHGERHQLRIAIKKLRYMIEFLGGLFDGRDVRAFMKRLKPLQEELGYVNDVRTAQKLMSEVVRSAHLGGGNAAEDAALVIGWHIRGIADQEAKLRRDLRRLRKANPFWRPAAVPAP